MNRDIRDLWAEALRSGRYEQTTGQLAGGTQGVPRFCCLGVLCDLHSSVTHHDWQGDTYLGEDCLLPGMVAKWAGLCDGQILGDGSTTVEVRHEGGDTTLADLNDKGVSFMDIADIIEEEL